MKREVFNKLVDNICKICEITKDQLFSKSKIRKSVDARHLLYHTCKQRNMKLVTIQGYMNDNGYTINHSSIIHGINVVEENISHDSDYITITYQIQECSAL